MPGPAPGMSLMAGGGARRDHRVIADHLDSRSSPPPTGEPQGPAGRDPRPDGTEWNAWWGHPSWRPGFPPGARGRHGWVGRLCGGPFRRNRDERMIAGVAGGLAARLGVDPTLVRIGFVLFGLASGIGIAVYVLAWLFLPFAGENTTIASRAVSDARGLAVALAFVPALVVALIVSSALSVGYVSSMAWPAFLGAAGLVMIWRNADEEERAWLHHAARPVLQMGSGAHRTRRSFVIRVAAGILLLLAGLAVLVPSHHSPSLARALAGALLLVAALVVVFGPWWLSLARAVVAERQARVRAEERADMAARVHDSVLQTLAMIQRSAADPQRVVQLARNQERELRSWLFEGRAPGSFGEDDVSTFAAGVHLIEAHVELTHGISVEAVTVGDCELTDDLRALLAAGREATVNAAKWSGAPVVSLFAEVEPDKATLFVRDRGQGFDIGKVPSDRRGIAESIRGRMTRHGGTADVRSAAGGGTEVVLAIPRRREAGAAV